jgi:hypothetical protein
MATVNGWPWEVEVVFNPDTKLSSAGAAVVTSDSVVLDRARAWVNLNDYLISTIIWRSDL